MFFSLIFVIQNLMVTSEKITLQITIKKLRFDNRNTKIFNDNISFDNWFDGSAGFLIIKCWTIVCCTFGFCFLYYWWWYADYQQ